MDMLLNDSNKRKCPYCMQEFYPGLCRIMSGITKGKELKSAPTGRLAVLRAKNVEPEPLTGEKYTNELAGRECPYCKSLLPYNIESVECKSLVVIGDTYSGKSHFLAALVHQIQEGQVRNLNQYVRFNCLTPDVFEKYRQDYIKRLFIEKKSLDITDPATYIEPKKPLIYELSITKSEGRPPRNVNIILYDASGEDYARPERLVQHSLYVLNASALIFLADPISMPNIFNSLPDHLQNQPATGRRASEVFSSTMSIIARNSGVGISSRLVRLPVAITMSKSDLLKVLKRVTEPYNFLKNPKSGYVGGVDLKDLQVVDAEVRVLIDQYGDQMLLQSTKNLNAQFFAISATGHSPLADGTYPAVEPIRCLDPVLWVLYKLGIIEPR